MISSVYRLSFSLCLPAAVQELSSPILEKPYKDGASASGPTGQPAGKFWEKWKDQISERVMPTRAFCYFNPEWDIFHQERAETETDIYSSWYFSTPPLSLAPTLVWLTCWEWRSLKVVATFRLKSFQRRLYFWLVPMVMRLLETNFW